jgi:hypothetical protein
VKQFFHCRTQLSVDTLILNNLFVIVFPFQRTYFRFYQPQEEAGTAGEQPVSNKADGDDYRMAWDNFTPSFIIRAIWLKKLILSFIVNAVIFYETMPISYFCFFSSTALIRRNNFLAMRVIASLPFIRLQSC